MYYINYKTKLQYQKRQNFKHLINNVYRYVIILLKNMDFLRIKSKIC